MNPWNIIGWLVLIALVVLVVAAVGSYAKLAAPPVKIRTPDADPEPLSDETKRQLAEVKPITAAQVEAIAREHEPS